MNHKMGCAVLYTQDPNTPCTCDSSLADALATAQRKADREPTCLACEWLNGQEPSAERAAVRSALAGTIGVNTLASILSQHGIPVGRRSIERHRAHLRETA